MLSRLMPKQYGFFDLFERHAKTAMEGVQAFLHAVENWPDSVDDTERVTEIEHECDNIAHMTVDLLHRTFITPIDREQILKMVSLLDDIIDLTHAASQRMLLFELKSITPELKEMVKVLYESQKQITGMVGLLRHMDRENKAQDISKEIHKLENKGDRLLREGLAALFGSDMDVMCVIKMKEIYETVEDAIDACEDAANMIDGILLEHS